MASAGSIEGTVLGVMESWPLQLSIESGAQVYHVELTETTRVLRAGREVSPNSLRPQDLVRVTLSAPGAAPRSFFTERIELLD